MTNKAVSNWSATVWSGLTISKGIISTEYGKTFNTLFEKRHSSDYEAFAYCDKAFVDDLTPLAEAFLGKIKELISVY